MAIESTDGATKESFNVFSECIIWSRRGRAKESDPTEVQIQPKKEEEVVKNKSKYLPREDNFNPAIE